MNRLRIVSKVVIVLDLIVAALAVNMYDKDSITLHSAIITLFFCYFVFITCFAIILGSKKRA